MFVDDVKADDINSQFCPLSFSYLFKFAFSGLWILYFELCILYPYHCLVFGVLDLLEL